MPGGEASTEHVLDFGNIRVGDFKDQVFSIKNSGLYPVKFNFNMKKKVYRDCFRIEPMEAELEPNATKEIQMRFSSLKEVKLKANTTNTEFFCEIKEGRSLETFSQVPIGVSVNSVFSKYSIQPLKNINFGPIQFNESKTRTFEIKNNGQFEFNFQIYDFNNEEFRKELLSTQEKEYQAKLEAASAAFQPSQTDKKGKKEAKEVKKDDKKKAGKGKGEV
jgi:hydrocephalus-inducing protein